MRKEELIKRIENLENALQKEVGLREKIGQVANETRTVLNFVIEYGKDGVVVSNKYKGWGYSNYQITYIYKNQLKNCETNFSTELETILKSKIEIVKTDENGIIFSFANEYYKVDKANATYMQIPEPLFVSKEKERETKAKKKGARNET